MKFESKYYLYGNNCVVFTTITEEDCIKCLVVKVICNQRKVGDVFIVTKHDFEKNINAEVDITIVVRSTKRPDMF